jgi:hypothetical protein
MRRLCAQRAARQDACASSVEAATIVSFASSVGAAAEG